MPFHDNNDHCESPENAEPTLANEADEIADPNEPTDPTERIDPTLPIDRIEYADPIDRMDPSDLIDSIDLCECFDFLDWLVLAIPRSTTASALAEWSFGQWN